MDSMIRQPTSRTCFMCGRENSYGLKMVWYNNLESNQVEAVITIPEQFNGYPGIAHGGIVAAILDETSGRAVMLDGNFDNLYMETPSKINKKGRFFHLESLLLTSQDRSTLIK